MNRYSSRFYLWVGFLAVFIGLTISLLRTILAFYFIPEEFDWFKVLALLATLITFIGFIVLGLMVRSTLIDRDRLLQVSREREEEFLVVFDRAGIAKVEADSTTGRFLRVNQKLCQMVGYSEEELLTFNFLDLTHPEDRERASATFSRLLLNEEEQFNTVKRYLGKDGQIIWVRVTAILVESSNGKPARTLAVIQDITEQITAVENTNEEKRRLGYLIDSLPQNVWYTDEKAAVVFCNRRFLNYTGMTLDQLKTDPYRYLHADDREEMIQKWNQALQKVEIFEMEMRLLRARDNSYRWHLSRAVPITNKKGQVISWFGTSTDIEEQKRAIQAIARTNEDLEKLVKERTSDLEIANGLFKEATQTASAANRAKSEFLASISHEIRTPMMGILGLTTILQDSNLDASQKQHLKEIKQTSESLMAIFLDLLDFGSLDIGKLVLVSRPICLRSTLEDLIRPEMANAEAKGLKLFMDIAKNVPNQVESDPVRLNQLLRKLIHNAIKFTHEGSVTFQVRCNPEGVFQETTSDRPMIGLIFSITDTGIGISDEMSKVIFKPFVQADGTLQRIFGGSGLGLSIASGLIQLMGGKISLKSQLGQGSSFEVNLPMILGPDEQESNRDSGSFKENDNSPARILMVEDNPLNQKVSVYLLERLGHQTRVASSGKEALEILEQEEFDLILMDVQMPGMNGLQLTGIIRNREQKTKKHVPILALTAFAMPEDVQHCLDAGMDGHITKPLDGAALQQSLQRVFNKLPTNRRNKVLKALPSPFNYSESLKRLSGNTDLLAEVSSVFYHRSEETLNELNQALAKEDYPKIKEICHTWKGTLGYFSANPAIEATKKAEEACKQHHGIPEAIEVLVFEVERLRKALLEVTQKNHHNGSWRD